MQNVMASPEILTINSQEVILGLEIHESELYVFCRRKIQVFGLDLKMTAQIILNGEITNYSLSEGSLLLLYQSKLIQRRLISDWNVVSIVQDNSDATSIKFHGRHYASTSSPQQTRFYRLAQQDNFPQLIWRIANNPNTFYHLHLDNQDRLYVIQDSKISFRRQKATARKKQLDMQDIMRQKEEIKRDIMNTKPPEYDHYEHFKKIAEQQWNKIEASQIHLFEKAAQTEHNHTTMETQTHKDTNAIETQCTKDMVSVGTQSKPYILKLNHQQMAQLQTSITDKITQIQKILSQKLQNLRLFLQDNFKQLRQSHPLQSFQKQLPKTLQPLIVSCLKPCIEQLLKQTLRQIKDTHNSILSNYQIQNAEESAKMRQLSKQLVSSSKMITDKSVAVLLEVISRLNNQRNDAIQDIRKAITKTGQAIEEIREVVGEVRSHKDQTTGMLDRVEEELEGIAQMLAERNEARNGQNQSAQNVQASTPFMPYPMTQPPYQPPYYPYPPQYPYAPTYPMYPYGQQMPMPPMTAPTIPNPEHKQPATPLSDSLIKMLQRVAKAKKQSKS